jgi:uncharacterized membrane protein HdeD (DUF308 family)
VIPLIVGIVFVPYSFWLRHRWWPQIRARAAERGRLDRLESADEWMPALTWLVFALGIITIALGIAMLTSD